MNPLISKNRILSPLNRISIVSSIPIALVLSTVALSALAPSAQASNASLPDPSDCGVLFSSINGSLEGIGTSVGKFNGDWTVVNVLSDEDFEASTWKPADSSASRFWVQRYAAHFAGDFQSVQLRNPSGTGWTEQSRIWMANSGRIWSLSETWNSDWTEWSNVQCYIAPSVQIDPRDEEPYSRFVITGFNPYGGLLMTLEFREAEYVH